MTACSSRHWDRTITVTLATIHGLGSLPPHWGAPRRACTTWAFHKTSGVCAIAHSTFPSLGLCAIAHNPSVSVCLLTPAGCRFGSPLQRGCREVPFPAYVVPPPQSCPLDEHWVGASFQPFPASRTPGSVMRNCALGLAYAQLRITSSVP